MMCMNQCDYPGENGEPCRCQQDARNAFDGKLRSAVFARLGGVGAISPELYGLALQDIAKTMGCVMGENFKTKVESILRDIPCPID